VVRAHRLPRRLDLHDDRMTELRSSRDLTESLFQLFEDFWFFERLENVCDQVNWPTGLECPQVDTGPLRVFTRGQPSHRMHPDVSNTIPFYANHEAVCVP
jgi:hypothetical protein